ncbi:pyruvate dehydrogenase protein X component-like isoform X2 [Bacillus rossius redtenbacheri]|uniref:pyruvate dehydrogenase protein X component-like isoform X2 n=1 Tax=Bacillus rossius redtenbacheri TaxID=93214 RepID=UPI002FDD6F00
MFDYTQGPLFYKLLILNLNRGYASTIHRYSVVPENTKDVPVGQVIALLVGEGEDWRSVEMPSGSPGPQEPAAAAPSPAGSPTVEKTVPGQELKMPSLSPTMSEGTIVKWLKKEGDAITAGDALCDIQTDKAVMTLETDEEGILAKILVAENSPPVPVGQAIALLVAEGEDWRSVASPGGEAAVPDPAPAPDRQRQEPPAHAPGTHASYGPAVHLLLEQYGLEAGRVAATGRKGRLLKEDVLRHVAANALTPRPARQVPPPTQGAKSADQPGPPKATPAVQRPGANYVDIEMSSMRKTIAKRLTESKRTIPHAYGYADCSVDAVLAARKRLKEEGVSVSVNDFVVKAVGMALRQCPALNSHVAGDQVKILSDVDVCVAVATDAGLITPIVKDAARKSLAEISAAVRDLATRAREGKLQLHEFQGGSFTISNLGMFGVKEFSAIINPPQTGILAVGGGRAVLGAAGRPVTRMTITLSYDRRAIAEHEAAEFLETVGNFLEEPSMLLTGIRDKLKSAFAV